jgi:hypothetical protein
MESIANIMAKSKIGLQFYFHDSLFDNDDVKEPLKRFFSFAKAFLVYLK